MSRIQDALDKLRVDGGTKSAPGNEPLQTKSKKQANSHDDGYHSSSHGRVAQGNLAVGSLSEIHVDRARLIEFGLMPPGVDDSQLPEQFRRIKRPILQVAFGANSEGLENRNVAMIASALPGAGKSFCSYQLAVSIARERDLGVILIDADVVRPRMSDALGLTDKPGLIDYLLDPDLPLGEIFFQTNLHGIIVVPSGRRHPEATELLASRRMEQLIRRISSEFPSRIVLMDTPPLLMTNEAQVLVDKAGQIILIVDAGETTRDSVLHALEALNREKPINAILNKARGLNASRYGYGYQDGGESDESSTGD